MTLADLFPEEDYRFNFRFERGRISEFFGPTAQHDEIIEQRRFWLGEDESSKFKVQSSKFEGSKYVAVMAEGEWLLEEARRVVEADVQERFGRSVPPHPGPLPNGEGESQADLQRKGEGKLSGVSLGKGASAFDKCLALGREWEPDFLLLKADADEVVRLVAGCVCFPSSWSLAEKLGHPVEQIHGVVPGLNAGLGARIQNFLARLKPGVAWLRANWGLSRSPELNQHPERGLARLDEKVNLEEVWLRIEHQALVTLPRTKGVLFGIRIAVYPLREARQDPMVQRGLIRALQTMPEEMAQYKNIAVARGRLISLLDANSH